MFGQQRSSPASGLGQISVSMLFGRMVLLCDVIPACTLMCGSSRSFWPSR